MRAAGDSFRRASECLSGGVGLGGRSQGGERLARASRGAGEGRGGQGRRQERGQGRARASAGEGRPWRREGRGRGGLLAGWLARAPEAAAACLYPRQSHSHARTRLHRPPHTPDAHALTRPLITRIRIAVRHHSPPPSLPSPGPHALDTPDPPPLLIRITLCLCVAPPGGLQRECLCRNCLPSWAS